MALEQRCRGGWRAMLVWALLAASCAQAAFPPFLVISGTIRDQSFMHRDFENPNVPGTEQLGLVFPQIDPAVAVPQFVEFTQRNASAGTLLSAHNGNPARVSTLAANEYSRHSYDEYYNNVPGINIPYTVILNLTLTNATTGVYQYNGAGNFYPLGTNLGFSTEVLPVSGRRNFAFTTEYAVQFYYRGGEVFSFTGDDDLWVFINNKLTACDLGGIHPARQCQVSLDALNLTVNGTYTMQIFHAERHTTESNFQITTSILPDNHAPRVYSGSAVINEGGCQEFALASYITDQDLTDTVFFVRLLDNATLGFTPENADGGTLVVVADGSPDEPAEFNAWYGSTTTFRFCGATNWNGTVVLPFQANDTTSVSSNVANFSITLRPVNDPPVAYGGSATVQQDNATLIQLEYYNVDPLPSDRICFRLASPAPALGNVLWIDPVAGVLQYTGVLPGNDTVSFVVNDRGLGCDPALYTNNASSSGNVIEPGTGDSNTAIVNVTVIAAPVPSASPSPQVALPPPTLPPELLQATGTSSESSAASAGLTPGAVGGIVAGAVVAFVVAAVVVGAAVYYKFSAARLESQWSEQFRSAHGQMNPLYERQQTEVINPLYSTSGMGSISDVGV